MYERTKKNIKNALISVPTQMALILVGFFSRRIFINVLGTEVLGLSATATSILNALNLLELGIWEAVSVSLYKPLFDGDREKVREIVALQGWLYKRIGIIIMAAGFIVFCHAPVIFSKSDLPSWYGYITLLAVLIRVPLFYFFNYKRVLIYATQQDYKIVMWLRGLTLAKLLIQIYCVKKLENPYLWWLSIEVVYECLAALITRQIIRISFPYLWESVQCKNRLRTKYPEVLSRSKYVAFHSLGGFAKSQLTPILIYAFTSLSMVGMYDNYTLITVNLMTMLGCIEAGTGAGIGSVVAENNKTLTEKVFREYFSVKFFLLGFCVICVWFLCNPFITLWLGKDLLLGNLTVVLILASFFVMGMSDVIAAFKNAYGLFNDIWAPVAELAIGVGMSILLGRNYGLNGVLAGILLSNFLIRMVWRPVFVFRKGFKIPLGYYIKLNAKHIAIFATAFAIIWLIVGKIPVLAAESAVQFIIYGALVFSLALIIYGGALALSEKSLTGFVKRIIKAING